MLRAVEILEIISKYGGISLAGLVKIAGYPKTSVHDILRTLKERAMTYRCIGKVRYGIGLRAYAIGHSYSKNSGLLGNSCQYVKALAEDIGKAAPLGEIDGEKILYTAKCEPKRPIVTTPSIGDEEPIKNTALIKIAEVFIHHEKKICQLPEEEKNRTRTEGLVSHGLDGPGPFYNIASPIYNFETRLSGVADMFGVGEVGVDCSEELKKVRGCAGRISERLGFIQNRNPRYKKDGTE